MSATPAPRALSTRTLGRTGETIPVLGLGTGPGGMGLSDRKAIRLYNRAIDLGVTYIDTAPAYDRAQKQLRRVLRRRRDEVFLTTKAPRNTAEEVLASLRESLDTMDVEQVDLAFLHSVGSRDVEQLIGDGGGFDGLREARNRGWTRFIGFTAHDQPAKSARVLRAIGDLDVVMLAMNYVDRFTYGFEETVLPLAVEQNLGVLAMKAFGGARAMDYKRPVPSAFAAVGQDVHEAAYRYCAALPGVASVIIGAFDERELAQNVEWARGLSPLTPQEQERLRDLGRQAAETLGPHFGPVE